MYLTAFSIGYAVPTADFDASIHSVFQSTANLHLAKSGRLLTLVVSGEADLPQGIRLDTPTGFSFAELIVGEPVACRDGILRLDSLSLTVDFRKARIWKCNLPASSVDLTNPTVESAWKSVWQALNKRQLLAGAEIVADDLLRSGETLRTGVPRKAGQAMQSLLWATRQTDLMAVSTAARALIGLGSGLTPSGDDLLVGYLAGLWCAVWGRPDCEQFISGLGRRVVRLSRRTNDISRAYLYHAARGQVSSPLEALAKAISRGESGEPLLAAAESAMRVGHTSGMDSVTGLLIGLAAWGNVYFEKRFIARVLPDADRTASVR